MNVMKSLWASIQGDPVFMRRVNGWLTIFWIVMIPVSIGLGLLSSVAYVSALSLWALVSGHWSAWQAARVEVEQMAEAEAQVRNPVEDRVVAKLIEDTDLQPADAPAAGTPVSAPASPSLADVLTRLDAIGARLDQLDRSGRREPSPTVSEHRPASRPAPSPAGRSRS